MIVSRKPLSGGRSRKSMIGTGRAPSSTRAAPEFGDDRHVASAVSLRLNETVKLLCCTDSEKRRAQRCGERLHEHHVVTDVIDGHAGRLVFTVHDARPESFERLARRAFHESLEKDGRVDA